jgi:hypothetical protein
MYAECKPSWTKVCNACAKYIYIYIKRSLFTHRTGIRIQFDSAKELFLAAKEKFIATNNKQLELFCVSEVRTRSALPPHGSHADGRQCTYNTKRRSQHTQIATLEYLNLNFAEAVQGFEQFLTRTQHHHVAVI